MVEKYLLDKYGFEEEVAEEEQGVFRLTGYPKSVRKYKLVYELFNQSIEELYYWIFTHLTVDQGYPREEIEKITDIFASSEMSSYWGVTQQRLGLQQDKTAQFLRMINDMLKQLFQQVRELRILDERLDYYKDSQKIGEEGEAAEYALKGIYIDLVEGGAKNPSSIYGLSQQVGFTILPDLFFRVRVKGKDDIDMVCEKMKEHFNEKVIEVLKRKLYQYYNWKEKTNKELDQRKGFLLKFIRQHYNAIQLYMNWIKPYLKRINRLSPSEKKSASPELIAAFEGAMLEIEFLAKKKVGDFYAVNLINFDFRATPHMIWAEEYQKKPIMVGRTVINFRAYVWTEEEVKKYIEMKQEEDLELLKSIDETVKQAMDALGDELKAYLIAGGEKFGKEESVEELAANLYKKGKAKTEKEAKKMAEERLKQLRTENLAESILRQGGAKDKEEAMGRAKKIIIEEKKEKKEKEKKKKWGIFEPFIAVGSGFKEISGALSPKVSLKPNESSANKYKKKKNKSAAAKDAKGSIWQTYKNFKKAHGLLSW